MTEIDQSAEDRSTGDMPAGEMFDPEILDEREDARRDGVIGINNGNGG